MHKIQEIRCKCCGKLLAKVVKFEQLQIKCLRCKTINYY